MVRTKSLESENIVLSKILQELENETDSTQPQAWGNWGNWGNWTNWINWTNWMNWMNWWN